MLPGEADAVAGSAARIWSARGEVVGAGFVVGPDTVATCAHVVAEALGADPYAPEPPAGPVALDLPLLGDGEEPPRVTAVVTRWLPIAPDGTGDVALLRVREPLPAGARMPPLRRADELWGRPVRALGFPDGAWDGVWSAGRLRAAQGTGWVQLQGDPGEQPVVGGFSGSAVWDDGSGAVVGMTVAADRVETSTAYLVPIDRVLGLDPELLPCPYQGLAPFTEEHAAYFFGRDQEIERLVDTVGREPLVTLAGPSGAGKSSLLRAGLLPRLKQAGTAVVELPVGASVTDFRPDGTEQVLVLDQFEELAARDPRSAREQLEELVRLTGSGRVRAVLTLRWSALDELLTPALATVLEAGTLHITPLGRTNLRETIVRPAERAPGLTFEPGLVDRILDDAGAEPGQLPLVESLLADLWRRRDGGRLTWRGYAEAGGVSGAVSQHAERVVAELAGSGPDPDPDLEDRLRRLFSLLAAPDRAGRFVRRPVASGALAPELRTLVTPLAAGRLLVLGRDASGAEVVELAHQALIDHWPRLRDRLEQDRAFLAWRDQTDQQRDRWVGSGRDDGSLLRGSALAVAAEWLPVRGSEVAQVTREFVKRSAVRQRREVRRWRVVTALLAVLALAAGTLAVVAVQRGDRLAAQLAAARADVLGRESVARSESDPLMAAQLALAAYRADRTNPAARTALAAAYLSLQGTDLVLPDLGGNVGVAPVDADSALVVVPTGRIVVTGLSGPTPQRWPIPDDSIERPIAVSGRSLATTDAAGDLRVWDVPTRSLRQTVPVRGEVRSTVRWGDAHVGALVARPSGPVLVLVDTTTGAISERALPGAAPDLLRMTLLPDERTVLEEFAPGLQAPIAGRAVRVLAEDPAGDRELPLPIDAVPVRGGAARITCALPAQPRGSASVQVAPVAGTTAARTVELFWGTCADARRTLDGRWLVENTGEVRGRGQDVLRLTDLTDGAQFQAVVPPVPVESRGLPNGALAPDASVAAVRRPDGGATVLLMRGPTLDDDAATAALLRVQATPVPQGGDFHLAGTDGRYVVTGTEGVGLSVSDRASGARVAELPLDIRPSTSSVSVDDGVWLRQREPDGWALRRFALPSLRELPAVDVPPGDPASAYADTADVDRGAPPDGPVVVVTDAVLAAADRTTGARLGPWTPLGASEPERAALRQEADLWARPAHPGQVLVNIAPGGLQLWDAAAGELLGTIPVLAAGKAGVAVDRDGRRVAVLSVRQTLEVYDLDTLQALRPPIALSGLTPQGFTADGYLVATDVGYGNNRLVFLDLVLGREAGTIIPGTAVDQVGTMPTGETTVTGEVPGQAPTELALRGDSWFDHVCRVLDRPFTEAELAVLPGETDTSPPCGS
ncbi:serine protease [Pseudonocardia sp. MH-G8]|uniref:serine protease n=1 Tax=Pseudonocardia sp. MH-G8 TaxID=1854588 RepID=UPI000BA0C033|nr:serine protease [Pseudonocardia sp. MH-G8]OZM75925.1 hypothetical protein CFP66_44020 [Pseudonocardia sp. MH-G8]